MLKFLLKILIFVIVVALGLFYYEKFRSDGEFRENTLIKIKFWSHKVTDKVYEKATEYNPEGDLVPDQIDDVVKEEIKEVGRGIVKQNL